MQSCQKRLQKLTGTKFNLLQEMGDVLICLDSLQDIFGISDEDLQKAKNVKLARNMQRVKDNGTFD